MSPAADYVTAASRTETESRQRPHSRWELRALPGLVALMVRDLMAATGLAQLFEAGLLAKVPCAIAQSNHSTVAGFRTRGPTRTEFLGVSW